jgi:hypothetical protein
MGSRIRKILLDTVPPPPPVKVTGTLALTGGATAKSGNPMTFRATRTGGSDGYVRVNWSVTGGVCSPASGFFEWPDGVTTQQTVTVTATTTAVPVSGVLYIYGPTSDIGLVPPLGLSSANVTVTVPAVIEGPTRWAEIPEIVFVRGMSETEEMGIYYLDPSNLTATGDLWWLEDRRLKDETGADYTPRVPLEIVGALPSGVTFNSGTGELTYTAASDTIALTGAHSRAMVRLRAGTALSDQFMISVLRPTIVWGYGAESVAAQYGAAWGDPALGGTWKINVTAKLKTTNAWDTDPNVVFWTAGDYDGVANSTGNPVDMWNLYLIGARGNVRTRCAQYSGAFNTVARVTFKRIDSYDVGINFNFGIRQEFFSELTGITHDVIGNISQCYMRDYVRSGTLVNGEVLFEQDMGAVYDEKSDAHYPAVGKMFAANLLLYNNTSTSTKHHFYVHGRGRCYLIINNVRVGGGSPCSCVKFTTRYARIRNSWLSPLEDNSTVETNGDRNVKVIDGIACSEVIVFNNDIFGCYRTPETEYGGTQEIIFWRNRNSRGGCDEPAAPTYAFVTSFIGSWTIPTENGDGDPFDGSTPLRTIRKIRVYLGQDQAQVNAAESYYVPVSNTTTNAYLFATANGVWYYRAFAEAADVDKTLTASASGGLTGPLVIQYTATTPDGWRTGFRAWSRGYESDALNGWSGSPETYWSNDFYDAVLQTPLTDPGNPYTFKKYISHTRITWLQEGTFRRQVPIRDDGLWPQFTTVTSGPNYRMSVPKNWVDRSVTFTANNRYVGWTADDVVYRKADFSGALRAERWIDLNATGDDSIDRFTGPVDADHDHTINIPGRTEGSLNVLNDPRTFVFVKDGNGNYGDTGPHPEAAVPVDGSGIPTGPDNPIELPDWFKI